MTTSEFDWDDANIDHIAEHDVVPEEAEEVLLDPRGIPAPAYSAPTERRYAVIGRTRGGRMLFVVYTVRRGLNRVITARKPTAWEQRQYRRQRR